ncbi:crossover junction endonuclease MUS81 [Thrips palmi]|uniref:Crossover junction endonuclease MUS81 n=1 Tax=Thrips palmi TaxID=161013 RepID=A0A6P8YZ36_THRPL|nr:crossover junction endonuclease MUS81 [Thrips palmi]
MEPLNPNMKRIKKAPQKCPNPLFEEWLEQWRLEAVEKGSDMQYCFGKAVKSLRKYPLLLRSGRDCMILECFGNRLCQLLDRKLADYRKTHPEIDDIPPDENTPAQVAAPPPAKKRKTPKKKNVATNAKDHHEEEDGEPLEKIPRRNGGRKYVPAWRSGPYAILITLLTQENSPNYPGFMLKSELQDAAQPLCDKSFTRPDPGSQYTAWSSMSTLVKKGLVNRCSCPAKFSLTDEGRDMARLLKEKGEEDADTFSPSTEEPSSANTECNKVGNSKAKVKPSTAKTTTTASDWQESASSSKTLPAAQGVSKQRNKNLPSPLKNFGLQEPTSSNASDASVVLESGSFDVILLVDTCETGGATKKNHNQTVSELSKMNVPFEVRKLELGDFLWIARSKTSKEDELVLPYIVERKRMDDLGGSIKDGRFKEQKFRLKQSGIQNLIYLVESHGSDQHVGLPLSTVQQAAVNTQVVDGFIVKHTIDHLHSMAYLASLTRILGRTFLNKTLLGCPKKDLANFTMSDDFITLIKFQEFKHSSKKTKNFTVKEMLIRHLVQLKHLSVEKAIAIVGRYPTPQALIQASKFGGHDAMFADIPCLGTATCRNVGPATSKAVHYMYTTERLH